MKRDWLLYLVIFSLALNLGTIGTFAYLRSQDQRQGAVKEMEPPLPLRALWRELNMDASQRQAMRGLFPEHRRKVREIRQQLAQKRLELFDLIKGENPSRSAIQAKVREISNLQGNLEEEMARFLLEFKQHLKPEQHAAFLNLVQTRLGCDRPGPGPPWRWRPLGPHHGPMEGPGMGRGPGGPGCPD